MKSIYTIGIALLAASLLTACGPAEQETPEPPALPTEAEQAGEVVGDEMFVEAGCAACIYAMEGAKKCATAVKTGDKVYKVAGQGTDAHSMGLCKEARQARVVGVIEDDVLTASVFELK